MATSPSSNTPSLPRKDGKTRVLVREKVIKMGFVERLYSMLEDAEEEDFQDVVRWEADGKSFKVYKIPEFEENIIGMYFSLTKMRSFQRKLVTFGFERVQGGPARGAYGHEHFRRGNQSSLRRIKENDKEDSDHGSDVETCTEQPATRTVLQGRSFLPIPPHHQLRSDPVVAERDSMSSHFLRAVEASRPRRSQSAAVAEEEKRDHGVLHPTTANTLQELDAVSSIQRPIDPRLAYHPPSYLWSQPEDFLSSALRRSFLRPFPTPGLSPHELSSLYPSILGTDLSGSGLNASRQLLVGNPSEYLGRMGLTPTIGDAWPRLFPASTNHLLSDALSPPGMRSLLWPGGLNPAGLVAAQRSILQGRTASIIDPSTPEERALRDEIIEELMALRRNQQG